MQDQTLNNTGYPKKHIDPSKIKTGQSLDRGNLYEADGTLVGPIPTKEYASFEKWDNEIKNRGEDIRMKNNEEIAVTSEELDETGLKTAFMADKRDAIYRIATHLINKHSIKTIKGTRIREVFIYKDGIYISGEDVLKKDIRDLLKELCTTHYIKEIVETIKDSTTIDRDEFKADINLINLNNGTLNISTGELIEHDPKHIFFTKIPINYSKDAECPMIKKYLYEVLDDNNVIIIQEWLGYALYREYFIKKAIILVGEGDTGKTTLISLSGAFVGENNVSGVSLQKISSDKFAVAHLYNKHINLYDDLSFKDVNDNGAFKIATGGGIITGEKKFGDQFQFRNYAKLTFACNKIPDVKDTTDDAYFNRWMVVQFNKVIEEEKQDKQLIHKITTPDELSGLLNFGLEGLKRLLKNQRFSYDKEIDEIRTEMLRSGSAIARFICDCLEEKQGEWISKENMYRTFVQYAHSSKLPAVSNKAFGSKLRIFAPYIAEGKPKDPKTGQQITAWWNVKFKSESDQSLMEVRDKQEQQPLIS